MAVNYGFCDLCINPKDSDKKNLRGTLLKLIQNGYETIAVNQVLQESLFENEKKKKKKSGDNETVGFAVPGPFDVENLAEEFQGKLRILSRLTFIYSDPSKTHTLGQSSSLKKYNIYAVEPRTQAAFQFACSQLNVDIITLTASCTGLKLSRKLYYQAVDRGVHFELQYTDLVNTATRKLAIHYSQLFHMFGKNKSVIISSGASNECQIRNPYDVINLATVLGLNETKAKASILSQSRHLILKAEGRRYGKAVFTIQSTDEGRQSDEDSDVCIDAKKIRL